MEFILILADSYSVGFDVLYSLLRHLLVPGYLFFCDYLGMIANKVITVSMRLLSVVILKDPKVRQWSPVKDHPRKETSRGYLPICLLSLVVKLKYRLINRKPRA